MLYKSPLKFAWAVLIASTTVSSPVLAQVLAQSASTALPAGTQLKIGDSSQMAPINQAIKQSFENQYPNAKLAIATGDAAADVGAVLAGTLDLASISRPLTQDERRQGLVQLPVAREKIAIVIGTENPFQGSLTIEQVNQITTGEVTDWKQVGGKPGPIRVVQRPPTGNAAQALQRYPDLRTTLAGQEGNQPPVTIDGLAAALGKDGLSFALVSELVGRDSSIQALSMYGKWPADEKYPFSQPFTYVYKQEPSPAVQTFLDFVSEKTGQQAVVDAIATPKAFVTASAPTQSAPQQPENSPPPSDSTNEPINTAQAPVKPEDAGLGQIDWLPLVLSLLGLGLLALAVMRATAARQKQQSVPKPAPDYVNRVKTEMSPPTEPEADADALDFKVAGLDLETDDSPVAELDISPQEARRQEYIVPEFAEFNTQVQAATTQIQDEDSQDIAPLSEADTQLQDDDATTLQPPQKPEEQD
ncbi:Phosphate-binding protein PstS [Acaryochloris thomasi RCC1774]|uniref:Phosphate-binding protein PstS n=1 Tax=Acaryochloris thomasi RCC1774 TaxID=1764569 RepID=A0A2W1JR21_9CYAN|nr:substrate-binding domain-containing protein [Acaryochloris thomasi]PZD71611.1 Phosphate-binding protein PstS [Acaryochloris thomasi RCC1774]